MKKLLTILTAALCLLSANANAQALKAMYPCKEGMKLTFNHYGADGKLDCIYKSTVRSIKGDNVNGTLKMVYNFTDASGKAFFDGTNEYTMVVKKENGQTYTDMGEMGKVLKVQNFIPAGDASTVPVDLKAGQTLPNSVIYASIGMVKVTVSVTDRKVKEHKTVSTPAGEFDAYLLTEKVTTKAPFSTTVQTAESWIVEGYGAVLQTVYDNKGKLFSKLELKAK